MLLHQGVVPNVNLMLAAGCDSHWSETQACWNIDVDAWFQSSLPGVSVVGDGASIGGAVAAEQRGYEGRANADTNETHLDYAGLAENARTAISVFPIMKNARLVRSWAGIEGVMPDNIPVLGKGQADGTFHAFGFSAHGFQIGPVCGKIVSELVCDGITKMPIDAFSINRFSDSYAQSVRTCFRSRDSAEMDHEGEVFESYDAK